MDAHTFRMSRDPQGANSEGAERQPTRDPKVPQLPWNPCLRRADGIRSSERTGISRNFLLSKKNLEIKVPRRCRGYVDLKYIVWESSLVMEQRAFMQFLSLKKLSARDITAELEGVYGDQVLPPAAVKKWRKRFANGIVILEDDPQSGRRPRNDLCEFIQAMINKTPFISYKRVRQKLRIPKTICLRVLHGDLGLRNVISGGFHIR
jgi:hypothetical protein